MKGTASMWPHETEHLEESSGTNGESFRLCHAVLVLSNLSPTKLDYARCFYEDLLKLKHEDDFLLEQQGDSDITLTFKKCLTQKGKLHYKSDRILHCSKYWWCVH